MLNKKNDIDPIEKELINNIQVCKILGYAIYYSVFGVAYFLRFDIKRSEWK